MRRLSQRELKSLITALGPDKCEYSSSADQENDNGVRHMKGTRTVFPERGPLTKYAALFDARSCFDAIRLSFLRSATPEKELRYFSSALMEQVATSGKENPHPQKTSSHVLELSQQW